MSEGLSLPQGVSSVLRTSFTESRNVDVESISSLVDRQLAWEVDGIVVLGLAGEPYKLTEDDQMHTIA